MKPRWMSSTGRLVTVAVSRLVGCSSFLRWRGVVANRPEEILKADPESVGTAGETLDLGDIGFWDVCAIVDRRLSDPKYEPTLTFVIPDPDGGKARIVTDKIPAISKRGNLVENLNELRRPSN